MSRHLDPAWRPILTTAVEAPSPHNIQPWRFRLLGPARAQLYFDPGCALPYTDTTGSFMLSAMSMMVEALRISAANLGWQLRSKILSLKLDGKKPFASLELGRGVKSKAAYASELFYRRRTSRLSYRAEPAPEDAMRALAGLAQSHGHRLGWTREPSQIQKILRRNVDAMFEDLNDRPYAEELVKWFRYTKAQSKRHGDGLDTRCMNVSAMELAMTAKLPGLYRAPLLGEIFKRFYLWRSGPAPVLGFLCGRFWKPADAVKAGRMHLPFWLELASRGLSIFPLGNLVTNQPARRDVEKLMGVKDMWFIFKAGFTDPAPKSRRRPVEEVLLAD